MIACVGVRIPIPFSTSNLRYFLYARTCHIIHQGKVNDMLFEDTINNDAPGLYGYDGRCIDVDKQGERQVSLLSSVDRVNEPIMLLNTVKGMELNGP